MTGTILSHNKRLIFSLLLLFGFSSTVMSFQKNLTGNINQPKSHVVSIPNPYPVSDRVIVDDATGFSVNDTILIIQMQGVGILTAPFGSYGTLQEIFGEPGMHEFLIITAVNANEIVFSSYLLKDYDPNGNIQIVRVPYYNSATVAGTLFCDSWNPATGSGGVLAMIIGRTLKLDADIDVSGRGLVGGITSIGDGICYYTNTTLYGEEYYDQNFPNAGFKGEGLAIHDNTGTLLSPNFVKGFGPNFTGGGGGNGRYSGGGGGSNRGEGGLGGKEDGSLCSTFPLPGGKGGFKADYTSLINRIYMGGGGGASTDSLTGSSSYGGNGGGIVIIVADTIIGNGGNILSNGGNGGSATGVAGSGGGGAAGSIALSLNSYGSTPLNFSLSGGKGGDNPGFGEGGGGGGGLLYVSTNTTGNVTFSLDGGLPGNYPSSTAVGGAGEKRLGFKAILNGFLFNSIRSSVTGDQVDSICSDMMPRKITGTIPVGGTSYNYLWQKSYDESFTSPITLANDGVSIDYTPIVKETTNVWFKRTVTDIPTSLVDVSKSVKIIVQPFIQNNNIVTDPDTICFNGDPPLMQQLLPDLIVPTTKYLIFNWQDSTDVSTWGSSKATSKDYDPSAGLDSTTWYRRTVTSGRCVDSTAIIKITVLPEITNNAFSQLFDTICFGGNTNLNTNTGPTGGLPTDYRYIWEQSTTGSAGTWAAISGETLPTFDPDASVSLPVGDHYYRRKVFSGEQNACRDSSGAALRKVWPVITNNLILADPTTCSGNPPTPLSGSNPADGAGPGSYSYLWLQSTNGTPWTSAAGINNSPSGSYLPTALIDSAWYRRIVNSSACTDTSLSIVAYKLPTANAGPDTVVCGSKVTLKATPSVGTGKWYFPVEVVASTPNNPSVTVTIDSTFAGGNISHKFIWEEINGQCKNKDTVVITFDKRVSSINAGPDTTLFSFDNIIHMVADPVLTWETGLWTVVSGTGDFDNSSDNLAEVTNLSKGTNTFLWTVTNGSCNLKDQVNVNVNDLLIPEGFSPNNDSWNNTFIIKGLDLPNQDAKLKVVNGAGTEVFSTSNRDGQVWTDWDGKNSKGFDLPEGTYYYLLKITSISNEQVFKKSGFIILKRY